MQDEELELTLQQDKIELSLRYAKLAEEHTVIEKSFNSECNNVLIKSFVRTPDIKTSNGFHVQVHCTLHVIVLFELCTVIIHTN